jgi:hypothetical protein
MRAVVLVLVSGCIDVASEHQCRNDEDCVRSGITGRCEQETHNCSFADTKCGDGGFRYDVDSGKRAGLCVVTLDVPIALDPIDLKQFSDDTKASCALAGARNTSIELVSTMSQVLFIDSALAGTMTTARLALREGACGDADAMELNCAGAPCGALPYSRLIAAVDPGRYCLVIEEADPTASGGVIQLRILPSRRAAQVVTDPGGMVSGNTCQSGPVANQCAIPTATSAAFLFPLCPGKQVSGTINAPAPTDPVLSIRHNIPEDPTNGGCVNNAAGQMPETFSAPAQSVPDGLWVVVTSAAECGPFSMTYNQN